MLLTLLKAKLHQARVTSGNVDYHGSMGISRELMNTVGIVPYEKILCANIANGNRWETYAIPVEEPGEIILNGAAALLGRPGDSVIIMCFAQMTPAEAERHVPKVAVLSQRNEVTELIERSGYDELHIADLEIKHR